MKRITLEIQYVDGKTEIRQFSDGKYIIGRDTGAIALHDNMVSGRHGELKVTGTTVVYTDQGSTNGTFTSDGIKLAGPLTLSAGTELQIGDCKIILKAIHQPSAATVMQPAVTPTKKERARTMLGQPVPNFAAMGGATSAPPSAATTPPASSIGASAVPSTSKTTLGQPAPNTPPAVVASRVPSTNATTLGQPAAGFVPPAATTEDPPPATTDVSSNAIASVSAASNQNQTQSTEADTPSDDHYNYDLNVGLLINAPMKDSQWLMKCLVMGLIALIPLAGMLNLMGWMTACYQNRKTGSDEIPPANFSYMSNGVKLFLAYLPAMGALIAVNVISGIITFIIPFLFFIGPLLSLAIGLYMFVFGPAITYLTVEKEISWASIRFAELIAFVKINTSAYTSLVIAFLIAGVVGGTGGIVVLGSLITVPFSAVMQAVILSEIK